jgi:hypothetical protein
MSTTIGELTAMLNSIPVRPVMGAENTARLLQMLGECSITCEICADACLAEETVSDLGRCITLNLHCAETCDATAHVIARLSDADTATLQSGLQHCANVCRACAAECEVHASMMEHCRRCADTCRRCVQACNDASAML